jgi:hypothetical protein
MLRHLTGLKNSLKSKAAEVEAGAASFFRCAGNQTLQQHSNRRESEKRIMPFEKLGKKDKPNFQFGTEKLQQRLHGHTAGGGRPTAT